MDKETALKKLETELKLRGFSTQTCKMYLFYNRKFLEHVNKKPGELTTEDIKEYLAYKISENLSNASLALIKASLKFFLKEILGKEFMIKTPRIAKKLPLVLSRQEIKDMIENTTHCKHRLLIELLYSSGLRLSECINLKYEDLDLNEGIGWVRSGKGSKDRIFIISETFKKDLLRCIETKKGYIFSHNGKKMSPRGIEYIISEAAKRAKINKKVHPHALRHTFATHMLENGVDIRKIQELLGHANLKTTQIYTQVSQEEIKKIKSPLDMI